MLAIHTPEPAGTGRGAVRTWPRVLAWALLLVAIEAAYIFFASAGTFTNWPTYMNYYDLLADGFRSGHLYIPVTPSADLLAQPNPHDPIHGNLWMWDISLYKDHYYLYWGPLPALLQAMAKAALRIFRPIGDQYLVFGFYSLSVGAATVLLVKLAGRLFPRLPRFVTPVAVLVFAFANPAPHLIATAGVYQAAISGGQAFLLVGIVFAFDAVWMACAPERVSWRLLAAGLAWALALACRVSLAPAIFLLVGLTAFLVAYWRGRDFSAFARCVVRTGGPVAVGIVGLLLYNRLRFDSWLQFGAELQLTTMKFRASGEYWAVNAFNYLLRPLSASCNFPFALQLVGPRGFPGWLQLPQGYLTQEPVAGILVAAPCVWLGAIALGAAVRAFLGGVRRSGPALTQRTVAYLWCATAFLICGVVSGLPEMGLYLATMRYLADVTSGLVLLGILGGFSLLQVARHSRWGKRATAAALCGLSAATIVCGVLLGFQGYNGHFKRFNPQLFDKLATRLSVCPPTSDTNQ